MVKYEDTKNTVEPISRTRLGRVVTFSEGTNA